MDIEVGEYVRTTQGYIAKVENIDDYAIWFDDSIWCEYEEVPLLYLKEDEERNYRGTIKQIVKHSKNIIDLIEVGDYVNGYRVIDTMEDMKTGEINLEMTSDYTNSELGDCTIYNKDIKSIVTKEQFQSIEYKVEE